MKNKSIAFVSIFIIFVLEIFYFISYGFDKGIVVTTGNIVLNIFQNSIYYLAYFLIYYIAVKHILNCKNFYFKKEVVKLFLILFSIRIIFDVVKLIISIIGIYVFPSFIFPIKNLLEVTFIIFMFSLFIKFFNYNILQFLKYNASKILAIILSLIVIISNILFTIWYQIEYIEVEKIYYKYNFTGSELDIISKTFLFQTYLFMTIITIITSIALFVFLIFCKSRDNNKHKIKDNKNKLISSVVATTIQCLLVIIVFVSLTFAKSFILPFGPIANYKEANKAEYSSNFGYTSLENTISRKCDYQFEDTVYNKNHINILYNNETILSLSPLITTDIHSIKTENSSNVVTIDSPLIELNTQDFQSYTYEDLVIMYLDVNNNPIALQNVDIADASKDDRLTIIIKELIAKGYWEYFEYGFEYLKKYDDSMFLEEYTSRYSKGDFAKEEQILNSHIKKEYMIEFAKSKINLF